MSSKVKRKAAPKTPEDIGIPEHILAAAREIAAGPPRKTVKVLAAPPNVDDFTAIIMREVDSNDSVQAAINADALMSDLEKRSQRLGLQREQQESVKLSIVAVCYPASGWELVDQSSVWIEPDSWSSKSWAAMLIWFNELNSIRTEDAKKRLAEAVTIAPTPPNGAHRASDRQSLER